MVERRRLHGILYGHFLSCISYYKSNKGITNVKTVIDIEAKNVCQDHYHHHHISIMELGHFLTRSGLTYPEVSSKVCHDSFCQLGNNVSLPWVIYCEAFYLHVVSSFSCIPAICPKLVLFLISLQFVYLFCDLSACILLFFTRIKTQKGEFAMVTLIFL